MPFEKNIALEQSVRIHSMLAAGRQIRSVAAKLNLCHKTVYARNRRIENQEFERKKYDSESRFLLGDAQELTKIGRFLAFNKFVTLDQMIAECNLACSKSTLSRFLKLKSELLI